jgi:cell division protein FtsB
MDQENNKQGVVSESTKSNAKVLLRCALIGIVIISLCTFVSGVMIYNANQERIKELEQQIEDKQEQVDELKFLIDSPIDFDYIVRIAREKLGLYFPDETIFHKDSNK